MTTYKRWPIGLQSSTTGDPQGIGEVIRELSEHNIATFSASSDSTSILSDLQHWHKETGVPHTGNYYPTRAEGDYHSNVPEYGKIPSRELAVRHWNNIEKKIPINDPTRSPIDWSIPCIWLSTWNEVRPYVGWSQMGSSAPPEDPVDGYAGNADLIGWQAYEIGREALNRGYRWAAFSFAGGDPEPGFWDAPGVIAYLKLCAQNPEQLGIALHEYSHVLTILGLPDKIGRFQQLHEACDRHNIRRPVIQIKEFGWEAIRIPDRDTAVAELIEVAQLYMQHPNIHGAAIWTVRPWQGSDIHNQVRGLIPHLRTAALAHAQPIKELILPEDDGSSPDGEDPDPEVIDEWPFSILALTAEEAKSKLTATSDEFGIDVSHWQEDRLNWNQLKKDGVRFAYIRVGSGYTLQDPNYTRNVNACLKHEIPFGNYFYLYEDVDMKQQARRFVQQADWRSTLLPAVDIEQRFLTAEQIKTFIEEFHHLLEVPPIMIYTRASLWNFIVPKSETWPTKHPLWVAHWETDTPLIPHHWDRWLFFQPGVKQGLPGYPDGDLDYDHFNGPIAELTQVDIKPRVRAVTYNDYIPFDSPVGNADQRRRKDKMYPGTWFDANPFRALYTNSSTGNQSYHTGNDLNKNSPEWDADKHAPVYAAAGGVVTFAGTRDIWGGVIIIKHDINLYSRYGHVENIAVQDGDLVSRGQKIAQVGQDALGGPFHLHFDISQTGILETKPGHWPGLDLEQLDRHYLDPKDYIDRHRPADTDSPVDPRLPAPTNFGYVTAQFLNFRSEASAAGGQATVISVLSHNTKVGIYSKLPNSWYHVRVGSQDGFVSGKYISDVPVPDRFDTSHFQTGMNVNPDAPHSNPVGTDMLKGLNWVRFVFKLSDRPIAAERGDIDKAFAQYDPIVRAYSEMGVKSLIIINQETHHGSPGDAGIHWPTFAQEFAAVAGQIASHYQEFTDGVAYQIWNEADLANNPFSIFLTPAEYATLLQPAADAIRAASPNSPIIFNGMATGPDAAVDYIKKCRDKLDGSLPIDAVGLHPYGRWGTQRPFPEWEFGTLGNAFELFRAQLSELKLWITEIGVAGDNPIESQHYPAIAAYLTDVYKTVSDQYADLVPVLIWFAWSDNMHNAGIVKADGNPKEHIFNAFKQIRDREF
jgi:GH25 family lysozyme M1 (1,4-beta-N-acetylmuramidase)